MEDHQRFLDISLRPLEVGNFVVSTKSCKNTPYLRYGVVLSVDHEMHKARVQSVDRCTKVSFNEPNRYFWVLKKSGIIFHNQRILVISPDRIPEEAIRLLRGALMDYEAR